jgi:hypothetical protein
LLFARPHLLSLVSQTPDLQTRVPTAGVQVATVVGVDGSAVPLSSLATQLPLPPLGALHHCLLASQSASVWQAVPQAPLVGSQIGPPAWPVQSALVLHLPQLPALEPVPTQNGAEVPQAALADEPESPLQATQVSLVESQTGVLPVQAVALVAEHCTQVLVVASQAGVGLEQSASVLHASHLPLFGPVVAQWVERHTVAPFIAVQLPSPLL